MNRTGKIARLPHGVREELNRRLRDNVSGPKICEWLNRLPAAKAVCADFAKRLGKPELPINEKHLSEWRRGGFQDWLREQQMLTDTREMARWSVKLARDAGGDLSEGAAVLLSGQLLKLLHGMAGLGNIQPTAPAANRSSRIQNRMDDAAECGNGKTNTFPMNPEGSSPPALSSNGEEREQALQSSENVVAVAGTGSVLPTESCTGTVRELAGGDARATHGEPEASPRPSPIRGEREKLLQRGKEKSQPDCSHFSGQEFPPSVEAERVGSVARTLGTLGMCLARIRSGDHNRVRLAQVDRKLAQRDKIIALERRKYDDERAEIAAKKKAEQKKKKRGSGLTSRGQIEYLRGRLFGPDHIIEQKEAAIKEAQKDLAILKKKFDISEEPSEGEKAGESNVQSPMSKADSASGAAVASGPEFGVLPRTCDQSVAEESKVESAAKAQGAKKFDVEAMLCETEEIKRELELLRAKLPAREGSSNGGGSHDGGLPVKAAFSTPAPPLPSGEIGTVSKEQWAQALKKFDDWALCELKRIKKEVAALKADVEASEGILSPKSNLQCPKSGASDSEPPSSDFGAAREK